MSDPTPLTFVSEEAHREFLWAMIDEANARSARLRSLLAQAIDHIDPVKIRRRAAADRVS